MRKPRLEYQNALYHVIARGNQRQKVFLDDGDFVRYLKYMAETFKDHDFVLHAYCLMTNHVHLLVRQNSPFPLSRAMQRLQSAYTIFFNCKHHRSGHLFQGRYKSILVDEDRYLIELVRYIHLNPRRAKMEAVLGKYHWSSHKQYLGKERDLLAPVDTDMVLSFFSKYKTIARDKYRKFMSEGIDQGHREDLYDLRSGRILGNEEFEGAVFKESGSKLKPSLKVVKTIDQLWNSLLERECCGVKPIGWERSRLMGETAFWSVEGAGKSRKEVAAYFEVDPSTVTRAMMRQVADWEKSPEMKIESEHWVRGL